MEEELAINGALIYEDTWNDESFDLGDSFFLTEISAEDESLREDFEDTFSEQF